MDKVRLRLQKQQDASFCKISVNEQLDVFGVLVVGGNPRYATASKGATDRHELISEALRRTSSCWFRKDTDRNL